jgi:hypothetical protein
MDSKYAYGLLNFYPMDNGQMVRNGSRPYVAFEMGDVETLMSYQAPGKEELFAVAGGSIWRLDNTGGLRASEFRASEFREAIWGQRGEMAAEALRLGLGSSRMQYVNFSNVGGTYLWCCNGVNAPLYWNGTEWADVEITGIDNPNLIVNVAVYQNRLFLVERGSLTIYYLGLNSIQGAASPLPLGAYFDRGGEIVAIGNLTVDGTQGPDDILVVFTSEGEVVSFRGRNPDNASDWAMIGKFYISRPLGYRCLIKYGGDLIVMTESGLAGLNTMISNELAGLSQAATAKIQPTWANLTRNRKDVFGWQILVYHRRGLVFVNVPEGGKYFQFVFNPLTLAWGEIRGWPCKCLAEHRGEIYGGCPDLVQHLDVGFTDNFPSGGKDAAGRYVLQSLPITAQIRQAFTPFGSGQGRNRYTLMRPYINSDNAPEIRVGIATDNNPNSILRWALLEAKKVPGPSEWRIAELRVSEWAHGGGLPKSRSRWVNVLGAGYNMSPAIEIKPNSENTLFSGFDVQYIPGGAL